MNKLVRTIKPPDGERHPFGDLVVAQDSSVFVSDSASPPIYVIRKWRDGAIHSLGAAIDLTTRDARVLSLPANATLLGVDGLYSAGKDITLGVIAGKSFYFNAAAQWCLFGDDGKDPDSAKLKPGLIMSVDTR